MSGPTDAPQRAPRLADGVSVVAVGEAVQLSRTLARGRAHAWLARLAGAPATLTVELDAIGAWAVQRFDGRSMASLADELAAHLALSRREAQVALGQFVQALLQRRLATLPPPTGSDAERAS